jgi:hypothetical protein
MCHFGGPTEVNAEMPSGPLLLRHYGNGVAIGSVLPARTGLAFRMPDPNHVFAQALAVPGDSGSGIISDNVRAVGVLVTVGVHSSNIGSGGVDAGGHPRYLFPGSREHNGTRHEFRKSAFLYSGFRLASALGLVVVEGFTGVCWLTQAGIANVVALMGASCSETQAILLRELVPEGGSIWLLPDGDKAGERMAEETLVIRDVPPRQARS